MALTDIAEQGPRPPDKIRLAVPREALARLPHIQAETAQASHLARFLKSAVGASAALMLLGAAALALVGGAGMRREFLWSLLLLIGAAAMLHSYIRSIAQAFDRAPLARSARELRAVLGYCGLAWGAGAFLLLGDNPVPAVGLGFAILPGALMALLLKDRIASLIFIVPITALTLAAAILAPWGGTWVAVTLLLVVQGSIAITLLVTGRAHTQLPAGFALH